MQQTKVVELVRNAQQVAVPLKVATVSVAVAKV